MSLDEPLNTPKPVTGDARVYSLNRPAEGLRAYRRREG
jgi:hypothetical protein